MQSARVPLAILGILLLNPGSALAADNADHPGGAALSLHTNRDVVIDVDSSVATIVDVPTYARTGSNILFLNRCTGGQTITRGYNDSRTNKSSIIDQTITFPAYPYGDASWNQVVAEVRDMLAPFGIDVTDQDPGSGVSHFEIIACGQSFLGSTTLGVAPSACGVIENAIGFAFVENHADDARSIAETIVHEAAHTWSMDHLYDCSDPMTYLNGCGDKYFQDEALQCAGLDNSRWVTQQCKCGGSTMNSFQTIINTFGPATPTPPNLTIIEPQHGAQVLPGFVVRPEVSDDNGLRDVSLYVDNVLILELTSPPYVFNGPMELSRGGHVVEVRATDRLGTTATTQINVIYGEACACADAEVCVDSICIAGPGMPGGLGTVCATDDQCATGICATGGDVSVCTATCTTTCTTGFDCIAAGSDSVCWPAATDTGGSTGGCAAGGGGPGGAALLLLMLLAIVTRRSQRQR